MKSTEYMPGIKHGSQISKKDITEIQKRINRKFIKKVQHPTLLLTIYNYSAKTQFDRAWDDYTRTCRGLIVDDNRNIIARPFPKIFNLNEPDEFAIDLENTIERPKFYNKFDGVLGILYPNKGKPAIATRGSFTNEQSQFASEWIQKRFSLSDFKSGYTYLFEIIHHSSRIVVNYDFEGLVLIGVLSIDNTHELNHIEEGLRLGIGFARDMLFTDILQALTYLEKADGREVEGFVAKFSNGYRIKMKSEDYTKLHKIIFHISSKNIWLALQNNQLESVYEILPTEMLSWVRDIEKDLTTRYNTLMETGNYIAKTALRKYETKEEIARYISLFPEKAIAFQIANGKKSKAEALVWKMIKPKYEKFSDEN